MDTQNLPVCTARNRPYMVAINPINRTAILFQPRCKQWSCPECAEMNKALWAMRTLYGVEELWEIGHEIYFTTITTHEKLSAETALMVWPKQWGKLRQRASRAVDTFEYLLVPEQHHTGKIHVHLLDTAALPKRWWKDNARQCGLGFMATHERVKSAEQSARYVTKYLSKQMEATEWPRGFRRVRTSRNWPKLPEEPGEHYAFRVIHKDRPMADQVAGLLNEGYEVTMADHRQAWELLRKLDNED